ncbi:MAG: ferrous iron transport protein B [Oscillospiraceae bacterium]
MGLTKSAVGTGAVDAGLEIKRRSPRDKVVALAGNPNVGKSTVFNGLTGMNQHTGNWPGKTVASAQGFCRSEENAYILVDIPGTYSLMAHSAEEEVARDFLCFGGPDAVVVVCDATCLERNLNLVLQTMEISPRVLVCVNLLDEARRKGIHINFKELSERLGVPVAGTVARDKKSLGELLDALDGLVDAPPPAAYAVRYPEPVERAAGAIGPLLREVCGDALSPRWLSLRLLEGDTALLAQAGEFLGTDLLGDRELTAAVEREREQLAAAGIDGERLRDLLASALVSAAETLCRGVVTSGNGGYARLDRRLDKIFTGRLTAYPVMLLMLAGIFWLTISGANVPSALLAKWLFALQDKIAALFVALGAPDWLRGLLVEGAYRVLAWVVSVMLPPMAIFFPLFTLLEDAGYLPRIAYNLDRPFKRCCACGKQALTMCMGFGCNAAGVTGCRIIDSPRERLLAVLTNCFVPCNGRFPTLIAVLTMFFAGSGESSLLSALLLTAVIVLGVGMTFLVTKLLSMTVLKGVPSSFTLEMPPYRRPQIGKVIVRSIFDRTLFVLGRAAAVAAPAGALIWLLSNVTVGELSLLARCAEALDPFARLMGLDGVLLMAFFLGFPANEIVLPIAIMAYLSQGTITELGTVAEMRAIFTANGWTWITAVNVLLFSLMHWPCSTTLLTMKKETGSWKWTALGFVIPTACGVAACMAFTAVTRIFM